MNVPFTAILRGRGHHALAALRCRVV